MSNNEINNDVIPNPTTKSIFLVDKNIDDNQMLNKSASASDSAKCVSLNLLKTGNVVERKNIINNKQLREIGTVTNKLFTCVICKQKFTKHDLLIIHFR